MFGPLSSDFSNPWCSINDYTGPIKGALEQEAQAEIGSDHPLFGKHLTALGRRADADDVLFAVDESEQVVILHLTFSGSMEAAAATQLTSFANIEEFIHHQYQPASIH